jgi:hypothetical protein
MHDDLRSRMLVPASLLGGTHSLRARRDVLQSVICLAISSLARRPGRKSTHLTRQSVE